MQSFFATSTANGSVVDASDPSVSAAAAADSKKKNNSARPPPSPSRTSSGNLVAKQQQQKQRKQPNDATAATSATSTKRTRSAYTQARIILLVLALLLGCVSLVQQHKIVVHHHANGGGMSSLALSLRNFHHHRHDGLPPSSPQHKNHRDPFLLVEGKKKKKYKAEKKMKKLSQQKNNNTKKKNGNHLRSADDTTTTTTTTGKAADSRNTRELVNKNGEGKKNGGKAGSGGGDAGNNALPKHMTGERDPCFVVYHIPKTGGISLGEYMKQIAKELKWSYTEWYSWYGKFGENDPNPYDSSNIRYNYNNNKVHIGHLTPHFETHTNTQRCYKMTLLREPVDRAISAFYYHRHRTSEWKQCFKFKCRLWWEYIDDATRRFAGHGKEAWNSYQVKKYRSGDVNGGEGSVSDTAFDDAKAFLDKFDFLCFLDDLVGCVSDMSKAIGIKHFNVLAKAKNVGKKRKVRGKDMTDEIKSQIAQANKNDVELYQWALQKFGHSSSYKPK